MSTDITIQFSNSCKTFDIPEIANIICNNLLKVTGYYAFAVSVTVTSAASHTEDIFSETVWRVYE